MMLVLAIGLLLVGVMIGGAGLRQAGRWTRRMAGPWRPGVGVAALIGLFGGLGLVARGAVVEGAVLAGVGLLLAVAARRRPALRFSGGSSMTRAEALSLLGLGPEADGPAIEAAYHRLMRRVHPDHGGASGLAAQLNAARAVLTA